jgi:Transglycosylase SLT domain
MSLHHRVMPFVFMVLFFPILLDSGIVFAGRPATKLERVQEELQYYKDATKLNDLLFREGLPVHMTVVVSMLKEIDKNLVKYYPKGPFTRNDFIALAWIESAFHQYEGGSKGEKGIFQIMPDEFHDFKVHTNYYNIDVNTHMAFRVLKGKYDKHHDYKKSIIAYNGLIYHHGKLSQKYWKAFMKRKIAVDLVLNDK